MPIKIIKRADRISAQQAEHLEPVKSAHPKAPVNLKPKTVKEARRAVAFVFGVQTGVGSQS